MEKIKDLKNRKERVESIFYKLSRNWFLLNENHEVEITCYPYYYSGMANTQNYWGYVKFETPELGNILIKAEIDDELNYLQPLEVKFNESEPIILTNYFNEGNELHRIEATNPVMVSIKELQALEMLYDYLTASSQ